MARNNVYDINVNVYYEKDAFNSSEKKDYFIQQIIKFMKDDFIKIINEECNLNNNIINFTVGKITYNHNFGQAYSTIHIEVDYDFDIELDFMNDENNEEKERFNIMEFEIMGRIEELIDDNKKFFNYPLSILSYDNMELYENESRVVSFYR